MEKILLDRKIGIERIVIRANLDTIMMPVKETQLSWLSDDVVALSARQENHRGPKRMDLRHGVA